MHYRMSEHVVLEFPYKVGNIVTTVSCQNGCVEAINKFTLFIDSTS
jgi:uncharacterized protein YkvS